MPKHRPLARGSLGESCYASGRWAGNPRRWCWPEHHRRRAGYLVGCVPGDVVLPSPPWAPRTRCFAPSVSGGGVGQHHHRAGYTVGRAPGDVVFYAPSPPGVRRTRYLAPSVSEVGVGQHHHRAGYPVGHAPGDVVSAPSPPGAWPTGCLALSVFGGGAAGPAPPGSGA